MTYHLFTFFVFLIVQHIMSHYSNFKQQADVFSKKVDSLAARTLIFLPQGLLVTKAKRRVNIGPKGNFWNLYFILVKPIGNSENIFLLLVGLGYKSCKTEVYLEGLHGLSQ